MKLKKYIIGVILPFAFCACESPEEIAGLPNNSGLTDVKLIIPVEEVEYSATVKGPYKDGETIYVKVPTTEDEPTDLTNLRLQAILENNCEILTPIPGIVDMTKPYKLIIKDGLGVISTNYVECVPILPKTIFNKVWNKSVTELEYPDGNIPCMAVSKDYLIIGRYGGDTFTYRIHDSQTGKYIGNIPALANTNYFTNFVGVDDAGHFFTCRHNKWGAQFRVNLLDETNLEKADGKAILAYATGDGCPAEFKANKVMVKGNLKEGKAVLYAVSNSLKKVFYWEFNDGTPISVKPNEILIGFDKDWLCTMAHPYSLDKPDNFYLAYSYWAESGKSKSVFQLYDGGETYVMNPLSHLDRIIGMDVFSMGDDVYLAILSHGATSFDNSKLKVFEITDPDKMSMELTDDGYDKFKVFESEAFPGGVGDYNSWGEVTSYKDGNAVYIYAATSRTDMNATGVYCYRMRYFAQ